MTSEPMTSTFQEASDSILVAATRNGDSQAFESLVKRYEARTFRVAFRMTGNREDARDIVQESFLKAFRHLDSFEERSSFSTWLTRIAINEGLMSLRKDRGRRKVFVDEMKSDADGLFPLEAPDRGKNPGETYEQREAYQILYEAMNHLSPESRTLVRFQLEERTVGEIAGILGLGISTLKSKLRRARRKLHVLLTSGPGFGIGGPIMATRTACGGGLNSRVWQKRIRSKSFGNAGSRARNAVAVAWPNVARKRTLESTGSRMLDVA